MNRLISVAQDLAFRLRPFTLHLSSLAGAMLMGILVAVVAMSAKPSVSDSTDRWSLPQWAPFVAGQKRADVTQLNIWAADPAKKRAEEVIKPEAPPWRFIGTVLNGAVPLAVIELDRGKKVQRLGLGDALPNGAPVIAIAPGELRYRENEAEQTIKLFSAERNLPNAAIPRKN